MPFIKGNRMALSWLFSPGFGLFFLMEWMKNGFLRITDSARQDLMICPPPSNTLPSIYILSGSIIKD